MARTSEETSGPILPSSVSERRVSAADPSGLEAECERLSEDLARLSQRLESLEREREFLLLHSRNMEREVRRLVRERAAAEQAHREDLARQQTQTRESETNLRDVLRAYEAVLASRSWRMLGPYRALGRLLRRLLQP